MRHSYQQNRPQKKRENEAACNYTPNQITELQSLKINMSKFCAPGVVKIRLLHFFSSFFLDKDKRSAYSSSTL